MRVFAVDLEALPRVQPQSKKLKQETDLLLLSAAGETVTQMKNWVFDGWVPSVISDYPPSERLTTEVWLSKNNVPYSNLIFGVDDWWKTCWQLDASFLITSDRERAVRVGMSKNVRSYLLVDRTDEVVEDGYVTVVQSFREITEKEKNLAR